MMGHLSLGMGEREGRQGPCVEVGEKACLVSYVGVGGREGLSSTICRGAGRFVLHVNNVRIIASLQVFKIVYLIT